MSITLRVRLNKTIDTSYPIIIGKRLPEIAREIAASRRWHRHFIVTDGNVRRLYGVEFSERLNSLGAATAIFSVPPGERSKTRETKQVLEDRLIRAGAGRDSLIIALGGGMVGDLAGFIAATLFRGVDLIQIPTTLLAQADSSVGGKVGVDHPLGKNLIGAFHQPRRVYIDISTIRTLSDREYRNGLAELIKYGAILDEELFSLLERNHRTVLGRDPRTLKELIRRACGLKKTIVEHDERESGRRRVLNFGHTIGHAVESLSRYRIPHGRAVAIGMAAEAAISVRVCAFPESSLGRLLAVLKLYGLPCGIPRSLDPKEVFLETGKDKKAARGDVLYTLLERIGQARTGVRLTVRDALRAYLP